MHIPASKLIEKCYITTGIDGQLPRQKDVLVFFTYWDVVATNSLSVYYESVRAMRV